MKLKQQLLTLLLSLVCLLASAQCPEENKAFKSGETLIYDLYFNWKFIWVKVGNATMSTYETTYNGDPAYRCSLISRGNKDADRFFVMRDTLKCYTTRNMVPLYYRKGAEEGSRYTVDEVWYNYADKRVNLKQRYRNKHGKISTVKNSYTDCVYDMISMLLKARSFDGNDYKKGDKIQFMMADGDETSKQTLIYRGKKNFQMEGTKDTYRCMVWSFVEYENKKEKEVITFWVTDDDNHLPVRLDMYLHFGSAKAFLRSKQNIRNAETAKIK